MATGLILWISCLSLLLDASDGFAMAKGGGYRLDPASQNLEDDSALNFDQGEAFAEQLSGLIPPTYIQPLIAQPPRMVPLKLETVYPHSDNEMVKILNGVSRQWESNLLDPIIFPLPLGNPIVFQPQSAPIFYPSENIISLITGQTLQQGSPTPAQSLPYDAASYQFWQPASPVAVGSPYGSLYQQLYTGSSQGGDSSKPAVQVLLNRLPGVSEEPLSTSNMVGFMWPPAIYAPVAVQTPAGVPRMNAKPPVSFNTAEQSGHTGKTGNGWKLPAQPRAAGRSFKKNFKVSNVANEIPYLSKTSQWPQNSVFPEKYWVPQMRIPSRASQPVSSQPLRKSFVVRSKNAYQRKRFLQTKTTYIPYEKMNYVNSLEENAPMPARKPVQQGSISENVGKTSRMACLQGNECMK